MFAAETPIYAPCAPLAPLDPLGTMYCASLCHNAPPSDDMSDAKNPLEPVKNTLRHPLLVLAIATLWEETDSFSVLSFCCLLITVDWYAIPLLSRLADCFP